MILYIIFRRTLLYHSTPLDKRKKVGEPIPDRVEIWYDDAKLLSNIPDIYYLYSYGEGHLKLGSEEVLHLKSFNTIEGIKGISVRDSLKATIRGNIKSQELTSKLYDNGMTSKLVLQYTGNLNDEVVTIHWKFE